MILDPDPHPVTATVRDGSGEPVDAEVAWHIAGKSAILVGNEVQCVASGESTLKVVVGAVTESMQLRCHPNARISPENAIHFAIGSEPVTVALVDAGQVLDVPIRLASSNESVARVGNGSIWPVNTGFTEIEVQAGNVATRLDVQVAAPLRRHRVFGVEPGDDCSLVAVDSSGRAEQIGSAPGCICGRVLLDLDTARLAWIRESEGHFEAVTRWLSPEPGPIVELGPTDQDAWLGLVDGDFAVPSAGGGSIQIHDRNDDAVRTVLLPDGGRFVGADASGAPCIAQPQEHATGESLACLRGTSWTPQPQPQPQSSSYSSRYVVRRLVDGGSAARWRPPMHKMMTLPLTPIVGIGSVWERTAGFCSNSDECEVAAGVAVETGPRAFGNRHWWGIQRVGESLRGNLTSLDMSVLALSPDGTSLVASQSGQTWLSSTRCKLGPHPQFTLSLRDLEAAINDDSRLPEVRTRKVDDALYYRVDWR
jgi:hypothetical protein